MFMSSWRWTLHTTQIAANVYEWLSRTSCMTMHVAKSCKINDDNEMLSQVSPRAACKRKPLQVHSSPFLRESAVQYCPWRIAGRAQFLQVSLSCYGGGMRDPVILFVHIIATLARLGVRVESVLSPPSPFSSTTPDAQLSTQ